MDAATAVSFSRIANNFLADAIERHPAAAEKEIERGVTQLGMHVVVINSLTQCAYLSDPKFWVIFAAAEAFDGPIYRHPNALPEDRPFKRSLSWRRAVAGRRLGWPGPSVEALSAVFVFDGQRQSADDPG